MNNYLNIRTQKAFRLTGKANSKLIALANKTGKSQTEIVERGIQLAYMYEFGKENARYTPTKADIQQELKEKETRKCIDVCTKAQI